MAKNLIFVIENDTAIVDAVNNSLYRAGYQTQIFTQGMSAINAMKQELPDLVIMDKMLPGMDSLTIARWIKEQGDTPILMITPRPPESDQNSTNEFGAKDFIVKPFSAQELLSRVREALRHTLTATQPIPEPPLEFGELKIDPTTRQVHLGENEIILSAKEFEMLWLIARHPSQVFTRDQLLERVWGHSEYIDPGTVTVHIRRLREKIEINPAEPVHVITVWGEGYKFEP